MNRLAALQPLYNGTGCHILTSQLECQTFKDAVLSELFDFSAMVALEDAVFGAGGCKLDAGWRAEANHANPTF